MSIETNAPIVHEENLAIETVYKGLKFPTNMDFLAPNDILVLEKNEGTVQRIVNGEMLPEPLLDVDVSSIGERGMLGIAIANNSGDKTPRVFLYYTKSENKSQDDDRNLASNNIYSYDLVDDKLVNPKILLHLSNLHQTQHNGGILLMGPDDYLYSIVGEGDTYYDGRAIKARTQNYKDGIDASGRGGILRITQDGQPTDDEGILGRSIPLRLYYAYGIRNSFGMDFDPITGNLWDTENGAHGGDEINLVKPGFNSGSKQVQGIASLQSDFSESELVSYGGKGHYSDPELTWNSSAGLTALKFLNSQKLGKVYQNDMFVGDFHNGYLYHFDMNDDRTRLNTSGLLEDKIVNSMNELHGIVFAEGFGGITDIKVGPDGYLYVLSLQQGGENCVPNKKSTDCISYDSGISGTIFRIIPK